MSMSQEVPPQPESDAEKEKQAVLREIAEAIIAGEYNCVAVAIVRLDGSRLCFYDGSATHALGLSMMLQRDIIHMIEDPE